jgi:hypothetical protein
VWTCPTTRQTSPVRAAVAVFSAGVLDGGLRGFPLAGIAPRAGWDSDNDDQADEDVERIHVSVFGDDRKDQVGSGPNDLSFWRPPNKPEVVDASARRHGPSRGPVRSSALRTGLLTGNKGSRREKLLT